MFSAYTTPNTSAADIMMFWPSGSYTLKPDPGHEPLCSQSGNDTALYAAARSKHSGGVQASMADASARFFIDGVNATTW